MVKRVCKETINWGLALSSHRVCSRSSNEMRNCVLKLSYACFLALFFFHRHLVFGGKQFQTEYPYSFQCYCSFTRKLLPFFFFTVNLCILSNINSCVLSFFPISFFAYCHLQCPKNFQKGPDVMLCYVVRVTIKHWLFDTLIQSFPSNAIIQSEHLRSSF